MSKKTKTRIVYVKEKKEASVMDRISENLKKYTDGKNHWQDRI